MPKFDYIQVPVTNNDTYDELWINPDHVVAVGDYVTGETHLIMINRQFSTPEPAARLVYRLTNGIRKPDASQTNPPVSGQEKGT